MVLFTKVIGLDSHFVYTWYKFWRGIKMDFHKSDLSEPGSTRSNNKK